MDAERWIYHIATAEDWDAAQRRGYYAPESLTREGFIHFSRCDQVLPVAETFYASRRDLLLLKVAVDALTAPLRWEAPAGGVPQGASSADLFPHLYGPLNLDAVAALLVFRPDENGRFTLPEGACR